MSTHDELLATWARQPHHQGRCFIQDGIIDQERWESTKPRVVFLLKEARHDEPDRSYDLREFIRHAGAYGQALKNASYWAYAIHHIARGTLLRFPVDEHGLAEATELFLSSAVVNIKKSGGTQRSIPSDLAWYGQTDGGFIRKQIESFNPRADVVVCGYTWPYVKHVWSEAKDGGYDGVYRVGQPVFVDFWHPAYQIPNELKYYALACLLQNSGALSREASLAA